MSRATATGIRLKPPTLRLVGSKVIQPAPGTKIPPRHGSTRRSPTAASCRDCKIAGDDPGPEAETARRFDERTAKSRQDPHPVQGLVGDWVPSSSRL